MRYPHADPTAGSAAAAGSAPAAASSARTAEPTERESSAPSPRALVARSALLGAVSLGILGDSLLRNGPWGLGLLVWMLVFATIAVMLVRLDGRALSRESRLWLAAAVLCTAGLCWRDADMLQLFDVLAMLTALVLLATSIDATPVPGLALARVRDLIGAAFGTGLEVATGVLPLLLRDAELHTTLRPSNDWGVRRIGRALVITTPILLVFTLLLTHADPIFGSFFTFPDVRLDVVVSHVVIAGFFAWVVAGWLHRSLLAHPDTATTLVTPLPLTLGATDVTLALGALNVLFAAFVVVQIGWLFGGEALVLRTTGLSYAEYARHGFFELTCVAGLLLPVLLGARALIAVSDGRTFRVYRRLAVPLVLLLGAIMCSAFARMRLYVHYYGISTDRLYATAFMIWLAIVFVWLACTVLRSRPRTFAAGLVASGFVVLFALNVLNPDALVARENLARGDAVGTRAAGADVRYVASLGGDAVPLLVSALTAPDSTVGASAPAERCAAATILLDRWTGKRHAQMARSWTQWNIARMRATRAVRAHEVALRQLACPKTSTVRGGGR
ncbi:MAG TPA: DUF4173 domain-containing protein [Gemmatimonadaceae bacterium]|nr:DUF4173 domain-containing protein [Gemmatimonadaceae bacterium]